jgi:hypothetical protein
MALGVVKRGEWGWAAGFAALVMALTTLPYLLAASASNDQWRFGGFLWGVEDGNSYIAKMGQGARGDWLFTLPYSSEPQQGVLIYPFYLWLGKLAGPEHEAQVWVYHGARLGFGFALLLVSYSFLAEFLPHPHQRRWGPALVGLGGGLGWLLVLLGQADLLGSLPVDFISPEAYTFLILYGLPHLAAARCLFLLSLLAYRRRAGLWAGLALFGVSLVQPLYVLVAWAIMGMDVALAWLFERTGPRPCTAAVVAGFLSAPLVLYTVYLFASDPLLRQWGAQNVLTSPHPVHYLLGYGLLLVFAVPGWRVLRGHNPALARLVGGWALLVPILLYLPIPPQRRLIEGFQLPLAALAVLGMTVAFPRRQRWLAPSVLGLSLPTSAMLLAGGMLVARAPGLPLYQPVDRLAAFEWLAHHVQPGQVVLSAFETGNALPAHTPLVAYVGHGPETAFLVEKLPRVAAFYQASTSSVERRALLSDGRIAMVIFGPNERLLGDFNPDLARDDLRWRFSAGDYSIYEVLP